MGTVVTFPVQKRPEPLKATEIYPSLEKAIVDGLCCELEFTIRKLKAIAGEDKATEYCVAALSAK